MENLEQLIVKNERLIYSIANYFSFYQNKEDLYQAGRLGMVLAYNTYDETYNTKFTTHAYPYIFGEMSRTISEDKSVKVSRNIQIMNLKIEKAKIYLEQKYMREPTFIEVSEYLEIPLDTVVKALSIPKKIISIDEPVNDDNMNLHETIGFEDKNIDELIMLREQLKKLDINERKLIEKRYIEGYTQQEMADYFNMSQVQIYRKEQKVFKKIKSNMVA